MASSLLAHTVTPLPAHRPVAFTTQPFEESEPPGAVDEIVSWMNGAQTLLFSSDFPHWDFDPPEAIPARFGPQVRRQILAENALASYPKLAGLARG